MNRFASLTLWSGLIAFAGCGSSSTPTAANIEPESPGAVATNSAGTTQAPGMSGTGSSPADIVSQFLDEIRRGGEDTLANDLLTQKAQSELKRIGQSVQPIGSPDARFQVTRFEKMPDDNKSALVHSLWSEPNGDGTSSQFQVVWAVHLEPAGWRISGLAMELEPGQAPMVIDFENGDLMAELLSPQAEQTTNSSQATAVDSTLSR
jgi:hypothetical protein